jgi:hypothetical protein
MANADITHQEARERDSQGTYYVDFDEESGCWGVFGSESGFCYATFTDWDEAKKHSRDMEAHERL